MGALHFGQDFATFPGITIIFFPLAKVKETDIVLIAPTVRKIIPIIKTKPERQNPPIKIQPSIAV